MVERCVVERCVVERCVVSCTCVVLLDFLLIKYTTDENICKILNKSNRYLLFKLGADYIDLAIETGRWKCLQKDNKIYALFVTN